MTLLGQQWMHRLWFNEANSAEAHATDGLYMFILWVSIASFVLLMTLMVFFVIKFRRGAPGAYKMSAAHNTPLELAWSIIPLLVMVVIFFYGFVGYINKLAAPAGAEEIRITGARWYWQATYSNGGVTREYKRLGNVDSPVFYVPAGRPVKLLMTSSDVIHSFYIPAFRSKMDVFPNRYTSFNFTAEQAGMEHEVFCAEYCGQKHSEMAAWIKVVTPEEYAAFKEEIGTVDPKADPATRGAYWWSRFGCRACHTTDGSPSTGPTWQNLWGYERSFTDGTSRVADHNYIRESVYDPKAQIREGYTPQMNSYQGLVSQEQLDDLIAFMQTLSDRGGPAPTEPEGAPDTSEPVRDLPTDAPLPEKDGEQ